MTKQQKQKAKMFNWRLKLQDEGWPNVRYDFGFQFPFGSCQYDTIAGVFFLYNKIRKELNMEDTLDVLGIKFKPKEIRKGKDNIVSQLKEAFEDVLSVEHPDDTTSTDDSEDADWVEWNDPRNILARIEKCENYEHVFEFLKNRAWDLWAAAPYVFNMAFCPYTATGVLSEDSNSENVKYGIMCALLKDYGLIENSIVFSGFDT